MAAYEEARKYKISEEVEGRAKLTIHDYNYLPGKITRLLFTLCLSSETRVLARQTSVHKPSAPLFKINLGSMSLGCSDPCYSVCENFEE